MGANNNPNTEELELINKYTRRDMTADELYVFSLTLCDNDIDRDFEYFSDSALESMARLFVGKTGIFDHNPKSENQTARIFSCRTEEDNTKRTQDGRLYRRLTARAYIPRSDQTEPMILSIESGIRKEVSVGCSVKSKTCSVCGKEAKAGCRHIPGRIYNGKLCSICLDEPNDAYEWSFVAIPSQRAAGVTKSYERKETYMGNLEKFFEQDEPSQTGEEFRALKEEFEKLRKQADDGAAYREVLSHDVRRFASVAIPELTPQALDLLTTELPLEELKTIRDRCEKRAKGFVPPKPQLFTATDSETDSRDATARGNSFYSGI